MKTAWMLLLARGAVLLGAGLLTSPLTPALGQDHPRRNAVVIVPDLRQRLAP